MVVIQIFFIFLIFTPKIGEDGHFDSIFSNGLKPPTSLTCSIFFLHTKIPWSFFFEKRQAVRRDQKFGGPGEGHAKMDGFWMSSATTCRFVFGVKVLEKLSGMMRIEIDMPLPFHRCEG